MVDIQSQLSPALIFEKYQLYQNTLDYTNNMLLSTQTRMNVLAPSILGEA